MIRSLVLAAALGFLGACALHTEPVVRASGARTVESRELPAFSAVSLGGEARLEITVGDPQKVTIEAEKSVVGLIDTSVRGTTLRIDRRARVDGGGGVIVRIAMPRLTRIGISGSCEGRIEGVRGEHLAVDLSGAGSLEATGQIDSLELAVAGSGEVDFRALESKRAAVDVSGAGHVVVNASEELTAKVAGVGEVRYAGRPARVERKVLGVGRIEPL